MGKHGWTPGSGPLPEGAAGTPDPEWDEYLAWRDRELAAGRDTEPEIWVPGAWEDGAWEDGAWEDGAWETAGPKAAGPVRPLFCQDGDGDLLPPGSVLAWLTEQAVGDLGRLSDSELVGVLRAAQRQIAREQYKQVLVTAEYGRRQQAAFEEAARAGIPVGCRPGGFPGEELAVELGVTRAEAGHRIDDAIDLTRRLPVTLAGMAAGLIDAERAGWITMYTRSLNPADTAVADEILAKAAPDLRAEQLARKAAALEMKLNPEAVKARRERAKRDGQRVEARREISGNASLAGRELDTAEVMASKAYIDAVAAELCNSGLVDGTLDRLRALALVDLTQGRNPLERIKPGAAPGGLAGPSPVPATDSPHGPADAGPPGTRSPGTGSPGTGSGEPGRLPALINLLVPAGTLLGWSDAPAQAGAWGLLDGAETRAAVKAAARHPRTRWCVTLTSPDGTALAHACAAGQHRQLLDDLGPQPPPDQLAELLRRLNTTFTPVARESCDHSGAEEHYTPSRKLRHLVRARSVTCDAPGCAAQAISTDLDHTVPWPDGPTDQCNLAPRCRTHHRAKQAPDWTVEQVAPGITRWTLPSGRAHVTTPTAYQT